MLLAYQGNYAGFVSDREQNAGGWFLSVYLIE
jgi:hypothetical protein